MNSVFFKYVAAFMLINIVSFLILIAVVNSLVTDYSVNSKLSALRRATGAVTDFLNEDGGGDRLSPFVDMLSRSTDGLLVIVTDEKGDVCVSSSPHGGSQGLLPEPNGHESVGMDYVGRLKKDGTLSFIGTMDGFLSEKSVVYAEALSRADGSFAGAVFACLPDSETDSLLSAMNKTLFMSSLWIMLAALVAVYFITERFVSPLRQMSRAAKQFAAGKFDVRVSVFGSDEVAELGRAFNNMAGSLASLEDMRRSFLANVSHDLRTPMTTIAGFIDGILDGAIPPEKQPYYLGLIASEVRRLSRLVSSLLDISRLEAGERKFTFEPFDICEMAREIVISFEQNIESKHLDVEFVTDEDNMTAYGDRDAIHQVLYNLLDNGIKFSRDGGKYRIGITAKEKKIEVSVYNEGDGIAPSDLPFVFDRFYKSDKSRGLDKTGVGLGLYISRTIIEAHGETIVAESEYGQWCRFSFTVKTPDAVIETAKKESRHQKHSDDSFRGTK